MDHTGEVGFLPRFERSDDEGEPGTVVSLDAREVPDAVSSILDANGEIHEEYDDASWMASAVCGLCSMNQIPLQLTLGYSEAEARAQLEEAGIAEVEVSYVGDVDETANVVTEVAPLCGAWVMDGESVTITVTSDVTMPNVQGADLFTAQMRLMELGLEPEPTASLQRSRAHPWRRARRFAWAMWWNSRTRQCRKGRTFGPTFFSPDGCASNNMQNPGGIRLVSCAYMN